MRAACLAVTKASAERKRSGLAPPSDGPVVMGGGGEAAPIVLRESVSGTDTTSMSFRLEGLLARRRHRWRGSARAMVACSAGLIMTVYVLIDHLLQRLTSFSFVVNEVIEAAAMGGLAALLLWLVVIRPLQAEADMQRQVAADREALLRADAEQQEFEARLHRVLDMAATEQAAYAATAKALRRGVPGLDAELLLADSSDAQLKQAVAVGGDESVARCGVTAPRDCPAIRRAQTLVFSSSDDLDACTYLELRADGPCAAACVPVSVGGRSIGVLHAATEASSPPPMDAIARLEAIATQTGSRLGLLRVMEATQLQAATDPLTGLLNRRSFENHVQDLLRRGESFAFAMADLDHFKRLNDTHGHDAGDRALRLFARTLRAALRADDLVCRYGGEEFTVLFPGRTASQAAAALQRVREDLLLAVAAGTVPPFTGSFGVTSSDEGHNLEDICRIADAALFRAKRAGRNRVVVEGQPDGGLPAADQNEGLAAAGQQQAVDPRPRPSSTGV